MKIQAQSEGGILISNVRTEAGPWNDTYNFNMTTGTASKPTSTVDAVTWYHASSTSNIDANAKGAGSLSAGDYATLDLSWNDDGIGYVDTNGNNSFDAGDSAYVLKKTVYIRSATTGNEMYGLKVITAVSSASSLSGGLNSSLRILVKCGSTVKIFAPLDLVANNPDSTHLTYTPGAAGTSVTAIDSSDSATTLMAETILAQSTQLSANPTSAQQVDIYIFFEGEDGGCISNNAVATFDDLSISVAFAALGSTAGN